MYIEELFYAVEKPQRYIGCELNSVKKEHEGRVKFALIYPDVYEIGMSHLGLKILYHILNAREDVVCERAFAPWFDMEDKLLSSNVLLFSLESRKSLSEFDILGFSLQSELTYTNVLNILRLSNIPLLSEDRKDGHPIVIAGGPCCANPAPLSRFIDAFVIGEGEEVVQEIVEVFCQTRGKRERVLEAFSSIEGVYVPQFPKFTKKRIIKDLDTAPFPTSQILPYMEIVHDRAQIEVQRGCGGGCRFCQAGMIYRPQRTRNAEKILELVRHTIKETGFEDISLLSLNLSDFAFVEALFLKLLSSFHSSCVSFSLPSLRINPQVLKAAHITASSKKTSLTFAPEVATKKLQRIINKEIEFEQILSTISEAKRLGWQKIKLYFMIGLPHEDTEDVEEMIRLVKECKRVFKGALNVNVSCFVPKPHTPFQWAGFLPLSDAEERLSYIRGKLSKVCRVRWQPPHLSLLEAALSRGDERLSEVLLKALEFGSRFDGWGEYTNIDAWFKAFECCGVELSQYLKSYKEDAPFPWEKIDFLVKKEFLKEEWKRACKQIKTKECGEGCNNCGVCQSLKFKSKKLILPKRESVSPKRLPSVARIRIKLTKTGILKYISHLDFLRLLKRTCRRASLPIAATSGFSPQLKVALSHALPLGLESEAEFADIELTQHMNEEEFTHILNESLPEGARILAARNIPLHSRSVEDISTHSLFLLRLDAFSLKEREEVLSSLKKKEIERWIVDAKVEADTLFLWLSHKIGVRKFFSLLSCPFPLFSIKRLEQFCLLAGKLLPVIEVI